MDFDVIRGVPNIQTPEWRQFFNDSKAELRKSQVAVKEREQKRFDDLAVNIAKRLSKQDPKVTTAEIEKPSPTVQDNKIDAKAILDVIREIGETLSSHAELIEDLDERVGKLEQTQTQKRNGRTAISHREPSQLDIEVIQNRFEEFGLCGEIRKIITPFEVING